MWDSTTGSGRSVMTAATCEVLMRLSPAVSVSEQSAKTASIAVQAAMRIPAAVVSKPARAAMTIVVPGVCPRVWTVTHPAAPPV